MTVSLNVVDVIEAIDAAGRQTIRKEHHDAGHQILDLKQMPTKEQWDENKEILHPLMGA